MKTDPTSAAEAAVKPLPCPFCGKKIKTDRAGVWLVQHTPGCILSHNGFPAEHSVDEKAWNRRSYTALASEAERLRAENEAFMGALDRLKKVFAPNKSKSRVLRLLEEYIEEERQAALSREEEGVSHEFVKATHAKVMADIAVHFRSRATQFERELADARASNAWRPIESAPRDQTVLLWVSNGFGHSHVKTGIVGPAAYPDLKIVSIYDDGETLGYTTESFVTHWMPLPARPDGGEG